MPIVKNLRHRYFQMVQASTPHEPYQHGNAVEVNCQQLETIIQSLDRAVPRHSERHPGARRRRQIVAPSDGSLDQKGGP